MSKEHVQIPNATGSDHTPLEILTPRQLAERL